MKNTSHHFLILKMLSTLTLRTCGSQCPLIVGSISLYQLHMAIMQGYISLPLDIVANVFSDGEHY